MKFCRAFLCEVTDKFFQRRDYKLKRIDEVEFADRERDILFHIIRYTVNFFMLYFSKTLHQQMRIVATDIVEYDGDSSCEFIDKLQSLYAAPRYFPVR